MKRTNIILLFFAAVLLVSCSKKESVAIDSIQVLGDEFYQGQVVNIGASVKTSNPDKAYYYWTCTGGSFRETQQGYVVQKWTAPRENGVYTLTCKVTCGGVSQTREVDVTVKGVFFDRFAGTNSWTVTNQSAALAYGRLETHVNSRPNDEVGFVVRGLGISNFFPPLSATIDAGISLSSTNPHTPKYPGLALDSLNKPIVNSSWKSTWDNPMGVGFTGSVPSTAITTSYYISELTVDWWPAHHTLNQVTYYAYNSPGDAVTSTINASDFDARITVSWTRKADAGAGISSSTGKFMIFFKTDAFKTGDIINSGQEATKNIGISMEEDYTIHVYAGTQKVFTTDGVKVWRAAHDNAPLQVNQYKLLYPNFTRVYITNLVVNNKPELLY